MVPSEPSGRFGFRVKARNVWKSFNWGAPLGGKLGFTILPP